MRRPAIWMCAALALGGCEREPPKSAIQPTLQPRPQPEPPPWLLLPWGTQLRAAPHDEAPALSLRAPDPAASPDDRGRVAKVIGKADPEGRWWQLETVAALDRGIAGVAIEGLDVYALTVYVPAGTGEPASSDSTAPQMVAIFSGVPVVQTGQARLPEFDREWQVAEAAKVYWPDGSAAGTVRKTHAFVTAGETKQVDGHARVCFAIRVGPPLATADQLCFDADAVHEATPTNPAAALDLGTLGDQIGDEVGVATGGLGMTGTGMQNGGPNYGSGFNEVGQLGHGSAKPSR